VAHPAPKNSECKNSLEKFSPRFFGTKTASSSLITLVNKDFVPLGKMSVSDVFWTLNSNIFLEFLSPPHLSLNDSESRFEDVGQANNNMDCDPTFAGACSSNEPHLLTQGNLNDIVRDLNLSKKQAEILGSRLKASSVPEH